MDVWYGDAPQKGLRINMIHNVNRPFSEMMLGLESYIPMYMTGQISPYYLNETPNQVFGHFLKVSGTVALSGECIAGFHNDGKYYLTKKKGRGVLLQTPRPGSFITCSPTYENFSFRQ